MSKLQGQRVLPVRMEDGKLHYYKVQFIFIDYETMRKLAMDAASVRFQAAMRSTVKMPSYVCSYEEVESV